MRNIKNIMKVLIAGMFILAFTTACEKEEILPLPQETSEVPVVGSKNGETSDVMISNNAVETSVSEGIEDHDNFDTQVKESRFKKPHSLEASDNDNVKDGKSNDDEDDGENGGTE